MSDKILLEICVFNTATAIAAEKAGADRIELCENYANGGTTPSYGYLKTVREKINIPVFPMMMMVFVLFFVQSALPSLDIVDVAVRNGTAAYLFGYIVQQPVAVMAAVSSIWFINLIIPAILGSVFVFKLHFFDRNL